MIRMNEPVHVTRFGGQVRQPFLMPQPLEHQPGTILILVCLADTVILY